MKSGDMRIKKELSVTILVKQPAGRCSFCLLAVVLPAAAGRIVPLLVLSFAKVPAAGGWSLAVGRTGGDLLHLVLGFRFVGYFSAFSSCFFSTSRPPFNHQFSWLLEEVSSCWCLAGVVRVLANFQSLFQAFFCPSIEDVLGLFFAAVVTFFRPESKCYTLSFFFVPASPAGLFFMVLAFPASFLSQTLLLISTVVWWDLRESCCRVFPLPTRVWLVPVLNFLQGSRCCYWTVFHGVGRTKTNLLHVVRSFRFARFSECFSAFFGQFFLGCWRRYVCYGGSFLLTGVKLLLPCSVLPSNLLDEQVQLLAEVPPATTGRISWY
ncbi:hypothetical protein Salat_0459700 [Sesamum alatum]|uniref:Transmembrane protein n=1 Tax=Sesamum alatum TaxID=300844 RepID=A0AAE1Z4C6_9LAMI|nr:hypothetical protein Salat_0459700 [Sesamum alatum]